jgi:hypothetical protein
MSDDFSQIHLNVSGQTVTLTGSIARITPTNVDTMITVAAKDNPASAVTVPVTIPNFPVHSVADAVIASVTGPAGRSFVIAPDGLSFTAS